MIKEISVKSIKEVVSRLCIKANCVLNEDILNAISTARSQEASPVGDRILAQLEENAARAKSKQMPICQDTGMAVVFVALGQNVHIVGGLLTEAIHQGVADGYEKGYLRKSIVNDPFLRQNTNDNTPAIIHIALVQGEHLDITVLPKGFGSENMSRIYMLKPSDGIAGVKQAVIETVRAAGPNACPPLCIGVGIGGNFESCALMAKKALLRPIGVASEEKETAQLEKALLQEINCLGIGPQGLGGTTTALGVAILKAPTHIAGMPVAINISCHVTRHAHARI